MSYEVIGDVESLGQFASNAGFTDLVEAAQGKGLSLLVRFLESGETDQTHDVAAQLRQLQAPPSVVETAKHLASLIEDQKSVLISDGIVEDDEEVEKAGYGVMIAFFPEGGAAQKLALQDGESISELHVTLAYLGHLIEDVNPDLLPLLESTVENFARQHGPVAGTFGGPGRFEATEHSDGKDVCYATFDSPSIQEFRQALVEALESAGFAPRKNFGYTPHMTLKYIDSGAELPVQRIEPIPALFSSIVLCIAGKRLPYILGGTSEYEFAASGTVAKVDSERQYVFGWFSIIAIDGKLIQDTQGDIITEATLEASAYDFVLHARRGGEMHDADKNDEVVVVSKLIESVVFSREKQEAMLRSLQDQGIKAELSLGCIAWWGGFYITDPETWRRIKSGELQAFSIGGRGHREKIDDSEVGKAYEDEMSWGIALRETFAKYDPDQPRDEQGRWTDAAGAGTLLGKPLGRKGIEQRKAIIQAMMRPGGVAESEIKNQLGWHGTAAGLRKHIAAMRRQGFEVEVNRQGGENAYQITRIPEKDAPKESPVAEPSATSISPREKNLYGHVTGSEILGGGINETRVIKFAGGGKGVFKPREGLAPGIMRGNISPGLDPEREVAAWELAKEVGMDDMVTPAVMRSVKGKEGVVSEFQKGRVADFYPPDVAYGSDDSLARAAIFDYVIGNEDRHQGNWLVDGKQLHLIDHGLAFPDRGKFGAGNHAFINAAVGPRSPEKGVAKFAAPYIQKLDRIKAILAKVGLPQGAIRGVEERINNLKKVKSWKDL